MAFKLEVIALGLRKLWTKSLFSQLNSSRTSDVQSGCWSEREDHWIRRNQESAQIAIWRNYPNWMFLLHGMLARIQLKVKASQNQNYEKSYVTNIFPKEISTLTGEIEENADKGKENIQTNGTLFSLPKVIFSLLLFNISILQSLI